MYDDTTPYTLDIPEPRPLNDRWNADTADLSVTPVSPREVSWVRIHAEAAQKAARVVQSLRRALPEAAVDVGVVQVGTTGSVSGHVHVKLSLKDAHMLAQLLSKENECQKTK